MRILSDWAFHVSFDPVELEKEKGVVIEEERLRNDLWQRAYIKHFGVQYQGSEYPVRMPIGDMKIIRSSTPELLKNFYHTWYRPELITVIAVGDFSGTNIRRLLDKYFSKAENASP